MHRRLPERDPLACLLGDPLLGPPLPHSFPPRSSGRYISVEDGQDMGAVPSLASVTHGQGAKISGQSERWFVAGKLSQ